MLRDPPTPSIPTPSGGHRNAELLDAGRSVGRRIEARTGGLLTRCSLGFGSGSPRGAAVSEIYIGAGGSGSR
eukprot:3622228-Pyramimonas_sp.AAC.1